MLNDIAHLGRQPCGFLMAKSVEIQNFRGFSAVEASDCKRINIVVGENGSGKTAFMEAVFLASALTPEIALRFRAFRGYENTVSGNPRDIERDMWGDLFHNHNFNNSISIKLKGTREQERTLSIIYNERNVTMTRATRSRDAGWSPVNFVWKGANDRTLHTSIPAIIDGKISIQPGPPPLIDSAFFAANHTYSPGETVNRFSSLSIHSAHDPIIENFKSQFSSMQELSIEMNAGAPLLYAKIKDTKDRLPVALISGGMNKLASILFSLPKFEHGIVLIDEIENGFYYKRMPLIWRSILHFAELYDVQIFASTHSVECLRAAAEVAKEHADAFSIIRVVNDGKLNETTLRQFTGPDFVSAVEDDIEVR
jgi:AAA15 family ATPase/GTPase